MFSIFCCITSTVVQIIDKCMKCCINLMRSVVNIRDNNRDTAPKFTIPENLEQKYFVIMNDH